MSGRDRPKSFLLSEEGIARSEKKKSHHRKPKAQEKLIASSLGGSKQKGSGSQAGSKGDVLVEGRKDLRLLTECKRTHQKKSIRVESEWLAKITGEARSNDAIPSLALQFDDEVMRRAATKAGVRDIPESDWVAVPLSWMRYLMELAGDG